MQTNLENYLEALVRIPSVTENAEGCQAVIEYVKEALAPYNLHITEVRNTPNPWLIATTQPTKTPDILLAAHLDVVPGEASAFELIKDNDTFRGRGVYDMKLAAACYLELFREHHAELKHLNVGLLFTTDEEAGGWCMTRILESGWRAGVVLLPDGGDNWRIEQRAKGLCRGEIIARGITAHGSRPWEGKNAIHELLSSLTVLRHEFHSETPENTTLSITMIGGGTAVNQLADYASATVDLRSFEASEIHRFKQTLEALAQQNEHISFDITLESDPLIFNKDAETVQSFYGAYKKVLGRDPQFTDSYGASDARFFADYNIPSIIIEPSGGGRHASNEWLKRGDFPLYYELIREWIMPRKP